MRSAIQDFRTDDRTWLIENNIPLAKHIAKRYQIPGCYELDDAIQDACVALMRAIDDFKPELGYQFSSFATAVIWRVLEHKRKVAVRKQGWSNQDDEQLESCYYDPEYHEPINLRVLNPRERRIIKARFWNQETLREIAVREGVSRERVRQIEAKALEKLRGSI
jgi:RNA polymerase sigma factor (sigma-70 family)